MDIDREYEEYRARSDMRDRIANEYEVRSLFAHEDGAFQLGIDYSRNAFPDFDFDPGPGTKTADTQGGALSFFYYPLRSLSWGRLGAGVMGSMYWAKYEFQTANNTPDNSTVHALDAYGARLTYEFQYWIGQWVVPHVLYGYEQIRMRPFSLASAGISYPSRTTNTQVFGGGLLLNLNRLESGTASKALVNTGIRKFYLAYTMLQRPAVSSTGLSHFLGLRFEM
jgi:hypothetical protein